MVNNLKIIGKTDKRGPFYKREAEYDQVLKTFQAINN